MAKIPLGRPEMTEEMIEAAASALRNERLVMGESVKKFEEEFARYIGTKHAISCSSGTNALQLAMIAAKVGGKEVLTTPFSFIATANAIIEAGAKPTFADSSEKDYNIDPIRVIKAIGENTAGVLPVHLYGNPTDMDPLIEVCRKKRLLLVEDACQAHGALYKGRKAGSIGDVGCFSFYPTKNMTVGGDGGMITTNDDKLLKEIAKLRDCGRVSRYVHDVVGYTSRLNTCNAAIGRVQLRNLDRYNERRRELANLYTQELKGLEHVAVPSLGDKNVTPVFHLYVIRCQRRDDL
ncbi:MAG TPA: DegT/DnrJ/EryC1/StrS family aminotransferase, partial [Methanomassiliicoccales archaeon]|nr:DegT/DnrJ/EryC1/StrS family aminotransferase [Methanomassiliicoccales archaeon]